MPTATATEASISLRVPLSTDLDLTALRDIAALGPDGAVATGLVFLLGMWHELGRDGFLRLAPPQGAVGTLPSAPPPVTTSSTDQRISVTLSPASQSLLDHLVEVFEETEQDIVRHAIHVAAVLHTQDAARGKVVAVGGYETAPRFDLGAIDA